MPLCSLKARRCLFVSARSRIIFSLREHTRQVQLLEHRAPRRSRSHHLRHRIAELTVCTEKEMSKASQMHIERFGLAHCHATSPIVSVCACE